ncbi:hypothetical protein L227DRAFT_581147 [Lentinus tigrinus ALCF2SS1-6]|uniref:Uncharacterized protein n=1 Tax=Lentinus tigrinus ALCF2SS1-6 TaxID=1328759 RepID=A0A5C2RRG1_9APHY|nr:hypothetical protein L227DRAFT_581147 [Lentinus tigrinus ALCF2SS1-6]
MSQTCRTQQDLQSRPAISALASATTACEYGPLSLPLALLPDTSKSMPSGFYIPSLVKALQDNIAKEWRFQSRTKLSSRLVGDDEPTRIQVEHPDM